MNELARGRGKDLNLGSLLQSYILSWLGLRSIEKPPLGGTVRCREEIQHLQNQQSQILWLRTPCLARMRGRFWQRAWAREQLQRGGGGRAGDPVGTHRKEENFKGSPQAHPRGKLGEEDAREETSCQSPGERRRRGKVQRHGNGRGSRSISWKRQRQGPGGRAEQEVGGPGPPVLPGGPGPPVLLGRPRLDLSQLRASSVNFTES